MKMNNPGGFERAAINTAVTSHRSKCVIPVVYPPFDHARTC